MIRRRALAPWFFVCLLGIAGTLLALPAAAQQAHDCTYVSFWSVPRASWPDAEKAMNAANAIQERLVANGTIIAWGSDRNLVHDSDGWTHADFLTAPSRAGILEAIDALRASVAASPVFATAKHWDVFLETIDHEGKTSRVKHGYIAVGLWRIKPGRGDDWVAIVRKYIEPTLNRMVADGTILMYNVDHAEFYSEGAPPGAYDIAVVLPDAKAVDAFFNEFNAYWQQNPAVLQAFSGLALTNSERDELGEIFAYQHK